MFQLVKRLENYSKLCQLKFNHLLNVFYVTSTKIYYLGIIRNCWGTT